ncbi:MAG TPA: GNAT family N-acetyltransferase [Candidatus Hydrogenedentes bacterium]|mgnify:CR=1 FL=1|nr:GNAT family N-acetyltransferase [Candidatus Hydrogenedentota bacterium]HPG69212.1 GNAT family N-acetyltransferase [Candidatus Hydrogenedentota bacterium]
MFEDLGARTLSNGETVSMAIIQGPEPAWADRIVTMLQHKGDPWNWQNAEMLTRDGEVGAFFHVLHREGVPFANVMIIEYAGVGLFGHVWTNADDRRKGAARMLIDDVMARFRDRGGQALFLGTGFDSHPYHLYERYGFTGIEPRSGYMEYYRDSKGVFHRDFFAVADTAIAPLSWRHWPTAAPLFIGDFPGTVRCASRKLFGRRSTEGPLLSAIREEDTRRARGEGPQTLVLESDVSSAVVGLAAWTWHPLWPDTVLLDVYCHPAYWNQAGDLLATLELPDTDRVMAYVDAACPQRKDALVAAGFRHGAALPRLLARDRAKTCLVDVEVLDRR